MIKFPIELLGKFKSENVKKVIQIEINLKDEADLKAKTKQVATLLKKFTREEHKEYLTKYKQFFIIVYSHASREVKIARLNQISEISLREPINITKPIRYIEFMVLAHLTEPLSQQFKDLAPLDAYIIDFVKKLGKEK